MEDEAPNIADASTQLPEHIESLRERLPWDEVAARARAHLESAVPELAPYIVDLDARVFGLSSGFFYLPAAQASQWGIDDPEWFDGLTQLLAIGHAHFAIQDALVDAGQCPAEQVLLSDVCLLEYLNSLDRLSTETLATYRSHHDLYYRWYLRALMIELKHRRHLHSYSAEEVSVLGLKAAPGNTVLHVIADAAGRPGDSGPLVRSVMQLCTGLQIIDDLNDMSVDLSDGNFTMPLTATLLRYEDQAECRSTMSRPWLPPAA